MLLRAIATISTALALAASVRAQTPLEGDLARLQGKWWAKMKVGNTGGEFLVVMTIEQDMLTSTGSDGTSRIRLDETTTPKQIDMVETHNKDLKAPDMFGIYELKGDSLKICLSLGKNRPKVFRASPKDFINVVVYTRGEPPKDALKKSGKPMPASFELKSATIVRVNRITAVLRDADNQEYEVVTNKTSKVLDMKGGTVYQTVLMYQVGNVVDARIEESGAGSQKKLILKEVRLIKGTLEDNGIFPARKSKSEPAAAPKAAEIGESYKGALIVKVEPMKVTIEADGRTIEIGRTNRDTIAYDDKGNQLPVRRQARVLRVGNKVDVTLLPRPTNPKRMPIIKEIRLISGRLDEPRK